MNEIRKRTYKVLLVLLLAWPLIGLVSPYAQAQGTKDLNTRIYQVQQAGVPTDLLNRLLTA